MSEKPPSPESWTSLTGFWTGSYWYDGQAQPTPFNAYIQEEGGAISGTTLEPNTFAAPELSELTGTISGARDGAGVSFIKRYDPGPLVHNLPILYDGAVDSGLSRIEGEWRFNIPSYPRGGFRLDRLKRTETKAEKRELVTAGMDGERGRDWRER